MIKQKAWDRKKYKEKFFNFIFLIRKIIKIDSTLRNIHKILTIKENIKKQLFIPIFDITYNVKYFFLLNINYDINKDMYLEF